MDTTRYKSCTPAENIFANLFVDTFGAEKADGRVLFLAHTQELVNQAAKTF